MIGCRKGETTKDCGVGGMKKIKIGEEIEDKGFYSQELREFLVEEEEITLEEDAFMLGYDGDFPTLGKFDEDEFSWDSGGEANVT